jgi:hypothetical protein
MSDLIHKTMGQQSGRRSWAEPWKIKMVEPLRITEPADRERALAEAGHNTFATMAQAHQAWVRELLSPLSAKEQSQLATLLGTLKTANPRPMRSSARKEKP